MSTVVQADIFFFITAVAVVSLAVLLATTLVYVVRILKNVLSISRLAKKKSEEISNDIDAVRAGLKKDGAKIRDDIMHISETVREESDEVVGDVRSVRESLRAEGGRFWSIFTFFLSFFTMNKGSKPIKRSRNSKSYGSTKKKKK